MQNLLKINLVPKYFTFAIEKAEKITHIDFRVAQNAQMLRFFKSAYSSSGSQP